MFFLYTDLQKGTSDGGTSQGCRGLGHVDSLNDTITVRFELAVDPLHSDLAVKKSKVTKRHKNGRSPDRVVEIELIQDKTALRSRKGDTGSVLWMAR